MKISTPFKHLYFNRNHPKKAAPPEQIIARQVQFSHVLEIHEIPNRSWFKKENLIYDLWISDEDTTLSEENVHKEILLYMKYNPYATQRQAEAALYQPESRVALSENSIQSILKKTTSALKQNNPLTVHFLPEINSLKIPNRVWLQRKNLIANLWRSKKDVTLSEKERAKEILSYIGTRKTLTTVEEAEKALYQPKSSTSSPIQVKK